MQGRLYNISNLSRLNNGTGYSDEKPGSEALNEHLLGQEVAELLGQAMTAFKHTILNTVEILMPGVSSSTSDTLSYRTLCCKTTSAA